MYIYFFALESYQTSTIDSPHKILGTLKVMLHGAIRNDDFYRNTALHCWNNVVTIRNNVASILQRCVALKVANRLV